MDSNKVQLKHAALFEGFQVPGLSQDMEKVLMLNGATKGQGVVTSITKDEDTLWVTFKKGQLEFRAMIPWVHVKSATPA